MGVNERQVMGLIASSSPSGHSELAAENLGAGEGHMADPDKE